MIFQKPEGKFIISKGNRVVVEDSFLNISDINYFKKGLIDIPDSEILYILLECSLETAIFRKPNLSERVIIEQYQIDTNQVPGELIFNTDQHGVGWILKQIEKYVSL